MMTKARVCMHTDTLTENCLLILTVLVKLRKKQKYVTLQPNTQVKYISQTIKEDTTVCRFL